MNRETGADRLTRSRFFSARGPGSPAPLGSVWEALPAFPMADARNPAIVLVDDEPDVLRAIARDVRRRYGDEYRVIRTDSGEEAVDTVRQLAERVRCLAASVHVVDS